MDMYLSTMVAFQMIETLRMGIPGTVKIMVNGKI